MQFGSAVQLLALELVGLAGMVLGLFWLRRRVGLTPLYVSLGVFQPIQVLLSSSIYVEVWPGISVSPGTLMFAASLLSILLVYIREDATEARKVIYGILGANLTMTLVMFMAGVQVMTPGTLNFLKIPPEIFSQGARVTAVGTSVFLADVALLILLYTAVRHLLPRRPFLRVLVTMAGVLVFDALAFTTGVFLERVDFGALLLAAVLSKLVIASFFSLALIIYLRFIEPSEIAGAAPNHPLRDFFYSFTYREKFELQARRTDEVEARLVKAQQVARMGFLEWNLDTGVIFWSDEMLRLIGLERGRNQQTLESTVAQVHPEDRAAAKVSFENAVEGGDLPSLDHRMLRADGSVMWVHAEAELIRDAAGRPLSFLGTMVDITQRKRDDEERRQVFERITDAFVAMDNHGVCTYVNSKAAQIFGREPAEMVGKDIRYEFPAGSSERFELSCRQAMADQHPAFLEEYYPALDRWFENRIYPSADGLTIYFLDITDRIALQKDLLNRANLDELTGLSNRRAMRDSLDALLTGNGVDTPRIGVIDLNLDRLHHVNDTLGYGVGDQVLMHVAQRLQRFAAATGCAVGRIGGDEFLLTTAPDADGASFDALARQAAHVVAQPYAVDGQSVYLTCSAGVSWSPEAGVDAAQLLGQADLALNLAKQRGRNQVVLFSAERSADLADRIGLGAQMREALQRKEICMHYQPLVDAASGRVVGAEALMRWNSGKLGPIAPSRFIPVAEDTGMIVRLGDWALRSAIEQLACWQAEGNQIIPLSVNVSAVQFQRSEFVEEVEDALAKAGVAPALLKIEITESVVMEDARAAVAMLKQLKQLGVRISLDDFGTGYSSLGYLRQLPIDEIKIDRSFVSDVIDDSYSATLCRAIIAMSQQLQLTVVAEGVETAAQALFLGEAGCHVLQGFLFSRPLPAEELGRLLIADAAWTLQGQRVDAH